MAGNERINCENVQNKGEGDINAKDFLIGALVGGIVGSLTALLLAPKSGRELREDINHQAYLLKEKTEQLRDTAKEKGNELALSVKDRTSAISKSVSEQSTNIVSKVKDFKGNFRNQDDEMEEEHPVDELFEKNLQSEIQQKLEETKRAFDETESKLNH